MDEIACVRLHTSGGWFVLISSKSKTKVRMTTSMTSTAKTRMYLVGMPYALRRLLRRERVEDDVLWRCSESSSDSRSGCCSSSAIEVGGRVTSGLVTEPLAMVPYVFELPAFSGSDHEELAWLCCCC